MSDPFPDDARYAEALPALRTERLLLRALTPADDPAIVTLFSDERALETWVTKPFTSLDDARAYRAMLATGFDRRTLFVWGVFEQASGDLVGAGVLTRWAPIHRRVDMGYYLASACWGRGYATEFTRAMLGFAFGTLGCHRVEVEIVPGNDASARVAERLGFVQEALLKERLWGGDTPEDCRLFRLFRREFEAQGHPTG